MAARRKSAGKADFLSLRFHSGSASKRRVLRELRLSLNYRAVGEYLPWTCHHDFATAPAVSQQGRLLEQHTEFEEAGLRDMAIARLSK
jgi:hypothetical protein